LIGFCRVQRSIVREKIKLRESLCEVNDPIAAVLPLLDLQGEKKDERMESKRRVEGRGRANLQAKNMRENEGERGER
jgi:hypothetical protein